MTRSEKQHGSSKYIPIASFGAAKTYMFLNLIVNFVPRVSRRRVDVHKQKHQCKPKFDFWRATSVLTLTLLPKIACMRPDPASEPTNTLWPPQTRSPKTNVHRVYIKNSLSQCKQLFLIPGTTLFKDCVRCYKYKMFNLWLHCYFHWFSFSLLKDATRCMFYHKSLSSSYLRVSLSIRKHKNSCWVSGKERTGLPETKKWK